MRDDHPVALLVDALVDQPSLDPSRISDSTWFQDDKADWLLSLSLLMENRLQPLLNHVQQKRRHLRVRVPQVKVMLREVAEVLLP